MVLKLFLKSVLKKDDNSILNKWYMYQQYFMRYLVALFLTLNAGKTEPAG